jgi:hypothetical protein
MGIRIVVSDAINRRVAGFSAERYQAFQAAAADVARGRVHGSRVHISAMTKREYYVLRRDPYSLYYSVDPQDRSSLVFEEFLTDGEENLVMDLFAEGAD